ncbi:MAG: winged helix-turn-helix transcriptional regulator [Candidatus Obscuribacterales bacterium]|nr:winged helix-turn-helix transcriptional regulator [Candidatus Obscuribacterales bacterium]
MPHRAVISSELARLFAVLSNPNRVRIVEELNTRELSVNDLQDLLGVTHAAVSQQLAVLRTNRIVSERREGRHVYYHLKDPALAAWVLSGISFISPDHREMQEMTNAIEKAKESWSAEDAAQDKEKSKSKAKKS